MIIILLSPSTLALNLSFNIFLCVEVAQIDFKHVIVVVLLSKEYNHSHFSYMKVWTCCW